MKLTPPSRRTERGFTIIELMVSLAVGLVLTLAVFATLAVSEGRRRTTTAVNDIGQTGNYALYMLDKWVRNAGSGFHSAANSAYGCKLNAAFGGTTLLPRTAALPDPFAAVSTANSNTFRLAPVLIVPGGTTPTVSTQSSDALIVMGGATGASALTLGFTAPPAVASLSLANSLNFQPNDILLLVDKATSTIQDCLITQVAGTLTTAGTATTIPLASSTSGGGYYQATIGSVSAATYSQASGGVLNIGNAGSTGSLPSMQVIGVGDHDTLYSYDLLRTTDPLVPLAEGVFEMHARYGIDTDADGIINLWVDPGSNSAYSVATLNAGTPAAAATLQTIRAIRVGLILRTPLSEKDTVTGTADTPKLFTDLTTFERPWLNDDERKYRYRVVEQTIPVRNALIATP